jgi:hypoxanthine phosphoribosyltransferase|tara:strand:+ start:670 stop:1251 length:582 start_codon:yes stop_codon:yes gene_type:complete
MNGLADIELVSGMPSGVGHAFAKAEIVFTKEQVTAAIDRLAVAITIALQDKNPVMLSVMQGGLYLTGQLMQRVIFPLQQGYVDVNRYQDSEQGGEITWQGAEHPPLQGRSVLLIDDVLNEGITLAYLKKWAFECGAKKVAIAVLADKNCSITDIQADYPVLACPNKFLFGCGMDVKGYGRNLPSIYALPSSLR